MIPQIKTDIDIKDLNTLRISARANYFVAVTENNQLSEILKLPDYKNLPKLILGGGSNILFTKDFPGLVIKIETQGKVVVHEDQQNVYLKVASGENWHDLVSYTVDHNWGGIENLALIPGTAGASPVQNIAAYGQNLSDTLESVEYLDIKQNQTKTLTASECKLSYRDSVFKHELRDRAIITSITIKLRKNPDLETSYYSIGGRNDSLIAELEKISQKPYSIKDVFNAVVAIRSRKLLDWKVKPTVGSFFVNPIVSKKTLATLQTEISNLQFYSVDGLEYGNTGNDSTVKIPVGRLLDHLGWKGKTVGNCMVSEKLASILTHNGKATGKEFLEFVELIKADVKAKLGVDLQTEVNIF